MTLQAGITAALIEVANTFNAIKVERGNLASLNTTDQTSLVNAINEVAAAAAAGAIDDASASNSTTYSSNKITADIQAAIDSLVNGAPGTLDTLNELSAAITGNDTDIAAILTAQANRVRFDINNQGLTTVQQGNARTNIGAQEAAEIGDTARDFTADFTGALT